MSAVRKTPKEAKSNRESPGFGLRRKDRAGEPVRVMIDSERCKGCGICTAFCPVGMLAVGDTVNSYGYPVVRVAEGKVCRGCGRCYAMCPDLVFTLCPGGDRP